MDTTERHSTSRERFLEAVLHSAINIALRFAFDHFRHREHMFLPFSLSKTHGPWPLRHMLVPIGQWVLEQACVEAASWPSDIKVAVNLSPRQFAGFSLPADVARSLASTGLAPHRLELEITESVFLSDTHENLRLLNDLKDLGVRIALDDFGTGYSSLAYLRKFSFDKLKIDRSFVSDVARSNENLAIVRAVIGLGRSFSAIVTAEGVEDIAQCERLEAEGCDQFQGYLFSKPVPLSRIEETFSQRQWRSLGVC